MKKQTHDQEEVKGFLSNYHLIHQNFQISGFNPETYFFTTLDTPRTGDINLHLLFLGLSTGSRNK